MTETILEKRNKRRVTISAGGLYKRLGKVLVWPLLLPGITWTALALWFDGPSARWLAGTLSAGFATGCLILLARLRPFLRAVLLVCAQLRLSHRNGLHGALGDAQGEGRIIFGNPRLLPAVRTLLRGGGRRGRGTAHSLQAHGSGLKYRFYWFGEFGSGLTQKARPSAWRAEDK